MFLFFSPILVSTNVTTKLKAYCRLGNFSRMCCEGRPTKKRRSIFLSHPTKLGLPDHLGLKVLQGSWQAFKVSTAPDFLSDRQRSDKSFSMNKGCQGKALTQHSCDWWSLSALSLQITSKVSLVCAAVSSQVWYLAELMGFNDYWV